MCARVSTSCVAPRLGLATLVGVISLATATVYGQEEAVKVKTEKKTDVDPSGTWKWEREFRETVLRSTLVLKKEADGKLTGTLQTIFGDGGGPGSDPVKIDNGKIDGDKVTFSVTRRFNDNEFTIDYVGKYANGKLGGTYTLDFGKSATTKPPGSHVIESVGICECCHRYCPETLWLAIWSDMTALPAW